jgi:hypothetical protein
MFISPTGAVGIGTTSPGSLLHIEQAGTAECFRITSSDAVSNGDRTVIISARKAGTAFHNLELEANSLIVDIQGSERARIDNSGRLLVGTSSAQSVSSVGLTPQFQLNSSNSSQNGSTLGIFANSASNNCRLALFRNRATTAGGFNYTGGTVQTNDVLGQIDFGGVDGQATPIMRTGATIQAVCEDTPTTAEMPTRVVFSVTADGASSPTEAFRITNDRVRAYNQAAPATVDTTATITAANLKTGIITSSTAAAVTMTLPTGTDIEAGFSGIYTNMTFEFSVINTGPNTLTVGANSNTTVGSLTVATLTSARYALRRTGANAFTLYRLS